MRFIFDECVSHRIAHALAALGKDACPYNAHWEKGTPDTEWIPGVSARGWCIVTSDCFRKPQEREALGQCAGRVILLAARNLSFWEQVRLVINHWERIEKEAEERDPPYILRFTKRSREPQVIRV